MTTKEVWRIGIQDKKNFKYWHWSKNFDTFDQALNSIKDWLSKNPGYNIRFHKEVLFVKE